MVPETDSELPEHGIKTESEEECRDCVIIAIFF